MIIIFSENPNKVEGGQIVGSLRLGSMFSLPHHSVPPLQVIKKTISVKGDGLLIFTRKPCKYCAKSWVESGWWRILLNNGKIVK